MLSLYVLFIIASSSEWTQALRNCIPNQVNALTLTDTILTWDSPEDAKIPNCTVTHYDIHIENDIDGYLFMYVVADTRLDVSFLRPCLTYDFTVEAFAGTYAGLKSKITAKLLPGPNATWEISTITATNVNMDIRVEWKMPDDIEDCVDYYRVGYWDEDAELPSYVPTKVNDFILLDVVPCTQYRFDVTAVYGSQETPTVHRNLTATAVRPRPITPVGMNETSNEMHFTWLLESYYENRCPVTAIIVNCTPLNYSKMIPINDSKDRSIIYVTLDDMKEGILYDCDIVVENTAGVSPPTSISFRPKSILDQVQKEDISKV